MLNGNGNHNSKCGCGRDARHRGRCAWRRNVSPATLAAAKANRKKYSDSGRHSERLREVLQSMEEVHLACIDFAYKYKDMQRKLQRVGVAELVAADPDLDESAPTVLS